MYLKSYIWHLHFFFVVGENKIMHFTKQEQYKASDIFASEFSFFIFSVSLSLLDLDCDIGCNDLSRVQIGSPLRKWLT